jgi:hypothetical protein
MYPKDYPQPKTAACGEVWQKAYWCSVMPFSETVIDHVELVVAVSCKYLNHMLQVPESYVTSEKYGHETA